MQYVTPEEILILHARVLDATGGIHGIRDVGLLTSVCRRPQASFGGKEQFASLFEKAAVYLDGLARYHVFLDGNKRTAVVSCARFLFVNGYELTATNKEVERYVLFLVNKKPEIPEIARWMKHHVKKY